MVGKSSGGKKHRISRIEVVGFGAGSVVLIIAVLLIFSIVRSRYKHASTTLHVGSDPGDQSTKPLVSPVNDIEVSQPEEEVGSKPRTTPGGYHTNRNYIMTLSLWYFQFMGLQTNQQFSKMSTHHHHQGLLPMQVTCHHPSQVVVLLVM